MWWCCNVPLTHVMPLQSTSTYVQWIPTVENVLESLLWGFTPVTLLAKHSTTSTSRAWCHDSTFRGCINSGGRCLAHQGAREVTNSVRDLPRPTRGWESVSWIYAPPKRRITTSASTTVEAVRTHHTQGLQEKNLSKARFSTFQVAQSKNTYMWAVLTHWLLQLRVNLHFPRRYWPMGCCFLVGSRFYRRFKRWYKGLKSRVVQVKYEEKGVTLLWI